MVASVSSADLHLALTSEYIVLMILICFHAHFNKTVQTITANELMNQVLVILNIRKQVKVIS